MQTLVRIGSLVAALGLAGLLTGCASSAGNTSQRSGYARDFEIVETSTKRNLTPKEMTQLREMVSEYLEKEGATESGDYYVKVFLTPEGQSVPPEWVVVRYSNPTVYTATRMSLLSSYPSYYAPYSSFYSYDYYPFSSYGFSRLSFQYYDDPFYYGYRNYYPRRNYAGHRYHGHHGNHGRHGNRHDRDRDDHRPPYVNRPPVNPHQPPAPPRVTTRTRWDSNSPERNRQPRENNFPHRNDPRRRWQQPNATAGQPATPHVLAPAPQLNSPATPANPARTGRPSRITTRQQNPGDVTAPSNRTTPSMRPNLSGRERNYTPPNHTMPARTSREPGASQPAPQRVRTATQIAPAARAEPASTPQRSYTPPATRSEPAPQQSQRTNVNDGGRRARSE